MRWSGVGQRAFTKRILAPVGAAASVAALIAVLTAVGHGPAPTPHPRPLAATAKPSVADKLIGREALDWYFPASGRTYTAGLAFAFRQDKITARDIDPCLASAGFPQPAFRQSQRLYQLSFPSGQFPDLAQLAAHPGQYHFTAQYLVLRHSTAARQQKLDHAQARCTARNAQLVTRVNTAASALSAHWLNAISAIDHSPKVAATQPVFASCLEAHGVPASLAGQTDNASSDPLFDGYFAWTDSTSQTATSSRQLAADERHEARVFLACAPGVVKVLEPIQLARRALFFHRHAAQIARITRLAEEMPGRHDR
jgi:hypothetical protein